jgi:hypothetical protein
MLSSLSRAGLRALNLRQNIIADAAVVNDCQCKGALEDLELRDNLLTAVSVQQQQGQQQPLLRQSGKAARCQVQ